jgi:hypothetical protein
MQQKTHGMAAFITEIEPDPNRHKFWMAFAQKDGKDNGLLLYTLSGDGPTRFKFNINRFYYHSAEARFQLLGWIGRHIDQTNEVVITLPPYERPNTWFPDINLQVEVNWIAPMGRVLDVAGLNGIPAGPGAFDARIEDPLCPWNEGIWRIESQDGALQVSKTNKSDCTLTIQGLSALLYGTNPPEDFPFRGWGDPGPETQETMQAMFPLAVPHIHAYF